MNDQELKGLQAATIEGSKPSNDEEFDCQPEITVSKATERPLYLKYRNRQYQLWQQYSYHIQPLW